MRTIVDIPKEDIAMLDAIAKREGVSRAELIRRGVESVLKRSADDLLCAKNEMFGFLKNDSDAFDGLGALAWQRKVRGEDGEIEPIAGGRYALSDYPHPPYRPKDKD